MPRGEEAHLAVFQRKQLKFTVGTPAKREGSAGIQDQLRESCFAEELWTGNRVKARRIFQSNRVRCSVLFPFKRKELTEKVRDDLEEKEWGYGEEDEVERQQKD